MTGCLPPSRKFLQQRDPSPNSEDGPHPKVTLTDTSWTHTFLQPVQSLHVGSTLGTGPTPGTGPRGSIVFIQNRPV